MKKLSIAVLVAAVALITASARAAEVKTNYEKHCAGCHGKDGKGQTTLGVKLGCQDYTDPKVQEKAKDEEMFKAVKEGFKKGDRSVMKPYAEKLTDDEIKELVKFFRKFKK